TKVHTQREDGSTPGGAALRQWMLDSLEESLCQLQTDWVDIWQIHNFNGPLFDQLDVVADVFEEVRAQGKVRWFGASTYGVEMPRLAIQSDLFDVVQVTYSVLDQRLADEVFAEAVAGDVGI